MAPVDTQTSDEDRPDGDVLPPLPRRKHCAMHCSDDLLKPKSGPDVAWCDPLIEQLGGEKQHTLSHLHVHVKEVKELTDPNACIQYID